jgi:hypothetical protein
LAVVVSVVKLAGHQSMIFGMGTSLQVNDKAEIGASQLSSDPRIARAVEKLSSIFVSGERPEVVSVQGKFTAYVRLGRRSLVAATNNRLIFVKRHVLGGFTMTDIQWQDVQDVHVRENMLPPLFGSSLAVSCKGQSDVSIDGLPAEGATALYRFSQSQEQAWREKNRVREMEEARARAGGIAIGASPRDGSHGASVPRSSAPGTDPIVRLTQAKELHKAGVLSDAEFETTKARLLSEL